MRSTASRAPGVLEHSTRQRLYEHLVLLPGDHFRSIVRSLGIAVGTARHHLDVMLRGGIVYAQKADGRCRYYVAGDQAQIDRNDLFGKHWGFRELRIRVWNALNRSGEASAARIAAVLGVTRQLASYHLRRLVAEGLVLAEKSRYRVNGSAAVAADRRDEITRSS